MPTSMDSSRHAQQVAADIALDMAVTRTLNQLGLEHNTQIAHPLSADYVATCCDVHERPVLSVIHLDDRRHWNLTVRVGDTENGMTLVPEARLAECLYAAADGTTLSVISPDTDFHWQLTVEVLEPAHL